MRLCHRGQETRGMRCPDYLGADLEEPVHQLHGIDVRHRSEHVTSEALARRAEAAAVRALLLGRMLSLSYPKDVAFVPVDLTQRDPVAQRRSLAGLAAGRGVMPRVEPSQAGLYDAPPARR